MKSFESKKTAMEYDYFYEDRLDEETCFFWRNVICRRKHVLGPKCKKCGWNPDVSEQRRNCMRAKQR